MKVNVQRLVLASGVLLMALASTGLAAAGGYGVGDPDKPISNPNWPKGAATLVNRTDRGGGYWINSNSWFWYAGRTDALNDFLAEYSKLQGTPLLLVLKTGDNGPAEAPRGQGYDWELKLIGWSKYTATVVVPLTQSRINLGTTVVPVNVKIQVDGQRTPEIERFLARQKARGKEAPTTRPATTRNANGKTP